MSQNSITTVSVRRQTVIPAKLGVNPGVKLRWEKTDNSTFTVHVLPKDPIQLLGGVLRGKGLNKKLLQIRNDDKTKE